MKSYKNTENKFDCSKIKKSVTGFSRLEYILGFQESAGIAAKFFDMPNFRVSDAYSVVKEVALSIEAQRDRYAKTRVDVSKLGFGVEKRTLEGYGKTKLQTITKTALSGLKKWELIKPISVNTYCALDGFRRIGCLCADGKIEAAKTLLYHFIIRKEDPFTPRRFLIKLRDYRLEKISFKKPQYAEMPFKEHGGVAYLDHTFINYLHTNSWAMTVMSDWASYFELTDWFPETFKINDIKFHSRMLILTKIIASVKEIMDLSSFEREQAFDQTSTMLEEYSRKTNLNQYAVQSICKCAEKLNLLKRSQNKVKYAEQFTVNEIIRKALSEKVLVVADSDEYKGVIFDLSSIPQISADHFFILMDEEISLERFYEQLYDGFIKSVKGKLYENSWIHEVRKEVCKSLHINSIKFDQSLTELCIKLGPPYIELAKVSIKAPAYLKSFIFMGATYHMIKVRKK